MTLLALCIPTGTALAGPVFLQTNLVSSVSGNAAVTDPNLLNPWGIANSATSPFWVSDEASNVATLYSNTGAINSKVVSVAGGPTGQVFNSAGGSNFLDGGTAASFIFSTLGGSVYAWNNGNGNTAQLEATTTGATFTGLALANNGSGNFLYAANDTASTGGIVVFNSDFIQVTPSGSFIDPNLPAGYEPYNVQAIGGLLYVEYTNTNDPRAVGSGIVDIFDANGVFSQRLITGGQLDDPWGVVMAPAGFGAYSGDLLVGNFGNGQINAFNPTTGAYLGTLDGPGGTPLVNQDLWALAVSPTAPNSVYFTAGIDGQTQGLFGDIVAAPEPGSVALVGLGCIALAWFSRRKGQNSGRQRSPEKVA
jgi:uncharacterized protein (TIGR03118 family)